MLKGNRTTFQGCVDTQKSLGCWSFAICLAALRLFHCDVTASSQRKQGKGITFIVPVPIRLNTQSPHYSTRWLLFWCPTKKKRKEEIRECWRINTRKDNPPRCWISQRLIVNNRLITETTGRQEQDQAQFKNVRLYQWMDANRLVGGPCEMGSIHRTWAERKNPHKVAKLALLVLQVKAQD